MKLVIFDGNSIINRAFYGIRPLTNSKGLHTNGIFGFLNILLKFIEDEKPDYLCIAFDLREKTFRHMQYEQYKAHRKGMPEELAEQMEPLKELLSAMNIAILEKEGYEADDIIGTVATLCKEQGTECVIATGDKDGLQLAGDGVIVKLAGTKAGKPETVSYDQEAVFQKYGVSPSQLIDVKALMGDPSDNIPGVAGIGEKTALSLIAQFSSIDNIYNNLDELDIKDTLRQRLRAGKEMAYLSHSLSTIHCSVPLESKNEDYLFEGKYDSKLATVLKNLDFNSFITRLNLEDVPIITQKRTIRVTVKEVGSEKITEYANKQKKLYFLFEQETQLLYFNLDGEICTYALENGLDFDFCGVLSDENIKKYTHGIKPFAHYLLEQEINIKGLAFDSEIAGYLINPSANSYNLDRLAEEFADTHANSISEFCHCLPTICDNMGNKIKENSQETLYFDMELPLCLVLASMEHYGFMVDKNALEEFSNKLNVRLNELTALIYECAGSEFNINSPKQLGTVLFETLNLPSYKKIKTGFSTNAEVLEKLQGAHIIIDYIMEFRQLAKLKSTYADGLLKVIGEDGRIHTSFNQTVTQTGRISSTEPNLQNIPVKAEIGKEIRKAFVAKEPDFVLLDADYSQIELRVLAHIADDKAMIEAFINNEDIHTNTASQVFNMPMEMVTPLMRNRAKAVNFGIVYGIGDFSLSQDIKVTRREARQYIDSYLQTYRGVKRYMTEIIKKAKEDGFVTTMFGRRRYIPELKVVNKNVLAFGERIALNTPIQGTAADIIKIAMVRVYNRLVEGHFRSRLILQVHDELIVEAHIDEAPKVSEIMCYEMENAAKLSVPLIAEVSKGKSWYEAKS